MNILQNPRVRIVIVMVIMLVIVTGVVYIMRNLLTTPQKVCYNNTHLDENSNKCVPNCQDGYINDPITGECVINCPDGEVSSKSISTVTISGPERCVVACGTGACDPESDKSLCQDGFCNKPNCNTEGGQPSYCGQGFNCGTDSTGKKKTTLPSDLTLDKYGCYEYNPSKRVSQPVCPSTTPDLISGTGTYSKEHVCCKTGDHHKYNEEGEPFCCPDEDDVIIDRKCCPKAQQCQVNGTTQCLTTDEVCTLEGKCKTKNAIGNAIDGYTGCCPNPTYNGKCYNTCKYVGTSDTGMKATCSTDADCDFKSGFQFDNNIPTAGGVCVKTKGEDKGVCRLYCGYAGIDIQDDVVCLNDPNSSTSTCINTSAKCEFTPDSYNKSMDKGAYICDDNTSDPPTSYWKSSLGSPTFTISAGIETPKNCTELSCLDRMITSGLLQATSDSQIDSKQKTLPLLKGSTTPIIKDSVCKATIECDQMKILQDKKIVDWPKQTVDPKYKSVIMNKTQFGSFIGSYTGDGQCYPGLTPSECVFLSDGRYSKNGTLDGSTPADVSYQGSGCRVAYPDNPAQTYNKDLTIMCDNVPVFKNGTATIRPYYFCTSWDACCGEGGSINSQDYTKCVCLANATLSTSGVCEYNTTTDGIIMANNPDINGGQTVNSPSDTFTNATYLSLIKTLSSEWVSTELGWKDRMQAKYSSAVVIMRYNNQYIGFNSNQLLGTVSSSSPINFYYTYCDGQDLKPHGQIPLIKGIFRFGSSSAFNTNITTKYLGRPVRIITSGVKTNPAKRDTTWGDSKMYDNGDLLTLIKYSGRWYLGALKCFYWQWGLSYGIQNGNGKIDYGVYNPTEEIFEFTTNDVTMATPIDIKYIFSVNPDTSTDTDDQFLSGITAKKLLDAASLDDNFTLKFSDLDLYVTTSAQPSN